MCLELRKHKHPLIATEDIIVYKYLLDNRDGGIKRYRKSLLTPFQKQPVEITCTYTSDFTFDRLGNVERGLHSYANRIDAWLNRTTNSVVVKCLIPKGSRYYQGWYRNVESLASDKLLYLEIL